MALDESFQQDPTAGEEAGNAGAEQQPQGTQPAATAAPAGKTYTDADFASARRSFERDAQRRQQAAIEAARSEWERANAPKPTASNSPWDQLDPQAQAVMRQILEHEFATRFQPVQQQQEDISFRAEEADVRSKYPDYAKNRTDVLQFGVEHGIANLEMAYRAWDYERVANVDREKIGREWYANYTKNKTKQAAATPSVEGRGGGAPTSKQTFKGKDGKLDRDAMDEAAKEMFRAAQSE